MFNFKKIGKKVLSSVLGATLAMGGFLNTQIVKAGEPDRNKYWDPFTIAFNAAFILEESYKENSKNPDKKSKPIGKFVDDLLNQNEGAKKIYDAVKEFITGEEAKFEKLSSIDGIIEITEVEGLSDNVKCKIATFEENGNQKAIVFIVLQNGGTLTEGHMEVIKQRLKNSNLITAKGNHYDCKNVNFIIRPQDRNAEFKIGKKAINGCHYATINAPGSNILGGAIYECQGAKINALRANISGKCAISNCPGAEINIVLAKISGEATINGCQYAKICAISAKISGNCVILGCRNATINAQGAEISGKDCDNSAIYLCDESIINAQGATISENAIVHCRYVQINAQEANIVAKNAIMNCFRAFIDLQRATISKEKAINNCGSSCINLKGADIRVKNAIYDFGQKKEEEYYGQLIQARELSLILYDEETKIPDGQEISLKYLIGRSDSTVRLTIYRGEKYNEELLKLEKEEKERNKQQDITNNNNGNGKNKSTATASQQQTLPPLPTASQQQQQPKPQPKPQPQNNNGNKTDDNKDDKGNDGNGGGEDKKEEQEQVDINKTIDGDEEDDNKEKTVNEDTDGDTDGGINTNTNIDNSNDNKEEEGQEEQQEEGKEENGNDNKGNENEIVNTDGDSIDTSIYTNNNDILDSGNNNVETKEKSKNWKTSFKCLGISGLIVLAVVAPIVAFKDKIKSIFGKNQNKKPIVKRIKTTN